MNLPKTAPTNLSHKPIVVVNNYAPVDGKFKNDTDAVALSVGLAQFDADELTAKVWRYNPEHERWSRQSEEVPLHRVLDLAILTIGALITDINTKYPKTTLREEVLNDKEFQLIVDYEKKNRKEIMPRLTSLRSVIDEYLKKYEG